MDTSRLSKWDVVGAVASVVLVAALFFLNWFELTPNETRAEGDGFICGVGEFECTGWETFPILRWLLIAGSVAPIVLAYIVATSQRLSWTPGEMTMVVGFTAFVLIAYNGIIDRPGSGLEEAGNSLQIGYFLALFSALGISAAGIARLTEATRGTRRTPGTV